MIDIVYESGGVMIEKVTEHGYIIRGYANGRSFPGGFDWIVVALVDALTVTFKGFLHIKNCLMPLSHARAVDIFFRSLGCEIVEYERVKNGIVINVSRRL